MGQENEFRVLLGKLDESTALFATERAFVICTSMEDPTLWRPKLYYAEIGDAIRGYVRYKLKTTDNSKPVPEIAQLLESVQSMESKLKDLGENMTKMWYEWLNDPIERACLEHSKQVKE